jgi:protein-S-isoprenylcysteine O-methyltransferase Ste14
MEPLIGHSGWHLWAFVGAIAVTAAPQMYARRRLQAQRDDRVRDGGSYQAVQLANMGGILLAALAAFRLEGAAIRDGREALFVVGLTIIVGSALLVMWTHALLGRSFTVQVVVREEQQIVESGPYRWVRHPSYGFQMLGLVGFALVLCNWVSVAVLVALPALAYGYRMQVEERALVEALGERYASYMRRTRRLVPFVW